MPKEKTAESNDVFYIEIALGILAVLVVFAATGLFFYRRRKQANFNEIPTVCLNKTFFTKLKKKQPFLQNEAEITNSSPLLTKRPIELLELKASGRFGDVWQGKLHNQDVAVKIFNMQEKESWNTEIEIYKVNRALIFDFVFNLMKIFVYSCRACAIKTF